MKTRYLLTALTFLCLPVANLHAASIVLWNTGVDSSGTKITTGSTADPHWTVTSGSLTTGGPSAVVLDDQKIGIYIQDPSSSWIYENADGYGSSSYATFSLQFYLTGLDPSSASIFGMFAVDNQATIYLNGQNVGIGTGELSYLISNSAAFTGWHNFNLNSGFQPGMNQLDVVVYNDSSVGGLNIRLEGSANAVPEPASTAMGIAGMGLLLLRRRR